MGSSVDLAVVAFQTGVGSVLRLYPLSKVGRIEATLILFPASETEVFFLKRTKCPRTLCVVGWQI